MTTFYTLLYLQSFLHLYSIIQISFLQRILHFTMKHDNYYSYLLSTLLEPSYLDMILSSYTAKLVSCDFHNLLKYYKYVLYISTCPPPPTASASIQLWQPSPRPDTNHLDQMPQLPPPLVGPAAPSPPPLRHRLSHLHRRSTSHPVAPSTDTDISLPSLHPPNPNPLNIT